MKRIAAIIFAAILLLSLFGCSSDSANEQPSTRLPSPSDYVSDASYIEEEAIILPYIDEGKISGDAVSNFNAEMREIYRSLTESHHTTIQNTDLYPARADYVSALNGNVLSVCVNYTHMGMPHSDTHYLTFNIDVTTAQPISLTQLYTLAGLSSDDVRHAVKIHREASLIYENSIYNFADKPNGRTLEDFLNEAPILYDTAYENGTLPAYLGNNGLVVFVSAYSPTKTTYFLEEIKPSRDTRKLASENAPAGVLASISNFPADSEIASASVSDEFILDGGGESVDSILVTILQDETNVHLEYVSYDYNLNEYSVREVPYNSTLSHGESIYIEAVRPETRPAEMRMVIQTENKRAVYYFSYNGRFGTPELEYIG